MNFIAPELAALGDASSLFDALDQMPGETYRETGRRRTFRFEYNGRAYFAKLHYGVGWLEILKNLILLRLPVVDAQNEIRAIRRLEALGIDTMRPVAFVSEQGSPASRRSLIVTEELRNTRSLEELALCGEISFALKRKLTRQVASIARVMHGGGVNHRDLYICHFHLAMDTADDPLPRLHVIDLHRAQVRQRTPLRWVTKDVGGLLFSVLDFDFSQRDALRFARHYATDRLAVAFSHQRFFRSVLVRAVDLYRKERGEDPRQAWLLVDSGS